MCFIITSVSSSHAWEPLALLSCLLQDLLFPICSFLWTFLGFPLNTTVLILLLHSQSLPAVFTPVWGIFFAFQLTALPLIFLLMQEAQHLSGLQFCTAKLVPWWGFLDPCSPHVCPLDDICSSLLIGLCASNRPSFKTAAQELLKTWMWSFHRRA